MPEINATHPGENVMQGSQNSPKKTSNFDLTYTCWDTRLFGYIKPHMIVETVPKDLIPYRNESETRTHTLGQMFMSDVFEKKTYINVPYEAILPLNWEKVYRTPKMGDDVPTDAGTYVDDFFVQLKNISITAFQKIILSYGEFWDSQSQTQEWGDAILIILKNLATLRLIWSKGSILTPLKIAAWRILTINWKNPDGTNAKKHTYDDFEEALLGSLLQLTLGKGVTILENPGERTQRTIDLGTIEGYRKAMEIFVQDYNATSAIQVPGINEEVLPLIFGSGSETYKIGKDGIDIGRIWAYQLACAEMFTNDNVDYIYNAELYRQYVGSIIAGENGYEYFTINGISYEYDYLSARYFRLISYLPEYIRALLAPKYSLRYMDYFAGAKTYPLAVGDTEITVNNGKVDVVDITKKRMYQKLWNFVNRVPQTLKGYIKEMFGIEQKQDYHVPEFLAETSDLIYGVETENTNFDDEGKEKPDNIRVNLRAKSNNFAFNFRADTAGFIIGVTWYDIPRAYSMGIDRLAMHADRYEMFNPFLQFIGDQEIYSAELDARNEGTYAYALRYMEYKTAHDIACGGFIDDLPGYIFKDGIESAEISPTTIRSKPHELDEFYLALTNIAWSKYFHFICKDVNHFEDTERDMYYAPEIM